MMASDDKWVLQIAHSYYPPFMDCARQYAVLFKDTEYKVLTLYLTGEENQEVKRGTASDEVIFMGYKSKQVSGLKIGAILKLRKILKQKNFVLCIAHRVKPTYVALLSTSLPIISIHHNYNDYSRWSRRVFINLFRDRLLMIGVSDSVRDDLRRDLKGWPTERIQTLYNHIDVEATQKLLLSKDEAREKLNLPKDAWVIGNVGRLHYDKDQSTLIKAFAKALPNLPLDTRLVIVGKGPLEQSLKDLTARLKVEKNVIFTGNIPNAKHFFKAFDLFVLTSDREPFGMVLLEAMAAELPIICSDCGGGAEVVRGVGKLFPFGNVNALKLAILDEKIHGQNNVEPNRSTHLTLKKLKDSFSDDALRMQFFEMIYESKFFNGSYCSHIKKY